MNSTDYLGYNRKDIINLIFSEEKSNCESKWFVQGPTVNKKAERQLKLSSSCWSNKWKTLGSQPMCCSCCSPVCCCASFTSVELTSIGHIWKFRPNTPPTIPEMKSMSVSVTANGTDSHRCQIEILPPYINAFVLGNHCVMSQGCSSLSLALNVCYLSEGDCYSLDVTTSSSNLFEEVWFCFLKDCHF